MTEKTIAMKLLEGKKVAFTTVTYPSTETDAELVAEALGVPAPQVFKTLVVLRPPAKPMLVMVSADRELDLKKLARAVGEKKVRMATQREAEQLTGLMVGGISALALINRGFSVFIDSTAESYDEVYVSAGQKGINLRLGVRDLVRLTGARFVDVAAEIN